MAVDAYVLLSVESIMLCVVLVCDDLIIAICCEYCVSITVLSNCFEESSDLFIPVI